jgi:hypothetical protein
LKINKIWLVEEDLKSMFLSEWKSLVLSNPNSMMKKMAENITKVKRAIKKWIPIYKARSHREIIEIENDISNDNNHPSQAQLEDIKSLEAHKLDWLEKEDTSCRLKNRALSLEA